MSLSEEEIDFLRFVNLVIKVAPNAVRYLFDQRFPAPDLALILQNNSSMLNKLKSSRVINAAQWDLLFPTGKTCSRTYDVTLMICLLRNIVPHRLSPIHKPATGFDQLPSNTDLSKGADLARVKHYRNFVAHHTEAKIPKPDYYSVWTDLCGAISRLGAQRYDKECSDLKVASFNVNDREDFMKYLKTMQDKYQMYIKEWRKDEETYTVTRATDYVANLIEKSNVVVVTGSSGSGKSSIIHHVALKLNKKEGYDIIPFVTGPADIIHCRDINKNQVFVIDDICGRNFIDELDLKTWINHADKIKKLLEEVAQDGNKGQMKILVSCRLLIFKDEQFQSLKLFIKQNVDLQSEKHCLILEEKHKILLQYITQSDLNFIQYNGVIKDYPYFPLLCKMSKGKSREQLIELFASPIESIKNDIKEMINFKPFEYCALVLCVLFQNGFDEAFVNPRTTPQDVKEKVMKTVSNFDVNLEIEMKRKQLLDTFKRLDGTYVKKIGPIFHIAHDKIYDITAGNCSKNLVELFIEYAPTSFIAERFRFSSVFPNQDQDDSVLYLSEDSENLYFYRIFKDLQVQDGNSLFYNKQLKEARYKEKVMGYIKQNTDNTDSCKHLLLELERKGVKIAKIYDGFSSDDYDCINAYNGSSALPSLSPRFLIQIGEGDENDGGDDDLLYVRHKNGDYYSTPLIEASKIGFYDLVEYLISIKCNVNKKDSKKCTSLYYSCKNGLVNIVELLITNGANSQELLKKYKYLFYDVCESGHTDMVKWLLDRNVDPSQCSGRGSGETPLYVACERGHTDLVKMLLDRKVDPSQCSGTLEWTPLYGACLMGHTKIVKLLLDRKVNPSQCCGGGSGETPLYGACKGGHTETVQLLLDKNVDVTQKTRWGETALDIAANEDIRNLIWRHMEHLN